MIDLHAHVLPGLDDGPETLEDALKLLRAAARDGVRTVAATPHLRADFPGVDVRTIAPLCVALNRAIAPQCEIEVVPGGEVDLVWALDASPEELRLASYGQRGAYLLVETPYGPLPSTLEDLLYSVSIKGYQVLLAHPERNSTFQADPSRLSRLVERGVLLQITAPSLTIAKRRSRSRELALALVREGLAHVIASDAHSAGPWRPPSLRGAVAMAATVAPSRAEWMVTDAPAAVLAGERLPEAPASTQAPRRGLLRRR